MGSCEKLGSLLGALNNRCRIIIRTQKGTIILTTTQMTHSGSPRSVGGIRRLIAAKVAEVHVTSENSGKYRGLST